MARHNGVPLVMDGCSVVAHVVLLLRIPGGLEEVGIAQQICHARKHNPHWQTYKAGNEIELISNWVLLSAREY